MKLALASLACAAASLPLTSAGAYEKEWAEFQAVQGQRDGPIPAAFMTNVDYVKAFNSSDTILTYTGPFAHLTFQEFLRKFGYDSANEVMHSPTVGSAACDTLKKSLPISRSIEIDVPFQLYEAGVISFKKCSGTNGPVEVISANGDCNRGTSSDNWKVDPGFGRDWGEKGTARLMMGTDGDGNRCISKGLHSEVSV